MIHLMLKWSHGVYSSTLKTRLNKEKKADPSETDSTDSVLFLSKSLLQTEKDSQDM